eukprot:TRINITY_DN3528_c0_g1_i4.p1 TRINITY_DN3528_c0_g1~~TRINITY_DN3528_c0_g1_i4.p1  ORF type:complete len:378 (-),score=49.36 TRINITY_DN3528_c0_g1_i4:43-1176(-)
MTSENSIESQHKVQVVEFFKGNLWNGETILFIQKKPQSSGDGYFLLCSLPVLISAVIPPLLLYYAIKPSEEWMFFLMMLSMAPAFFTLYFTSRIFESTVVFKMLALTNYRILVLSDRTMISLPYTNVEVKDWQKDGLQFWFTPNKHEKGRYAPVEVLGLSNEEKRQVQELLLQGKCQDLSSFQPSVPSPKWECDNKIAQIVNDHLPFLWECKGLPLLSFYHPWTKVFVWGFVIVYFTIGIVPGIMMGFAVSEFLQLLFTVISIAVWLFMVLWVMFYTQHYFVITERGLLKIETGLNGTIVQSIAFDKVYPIFSPSVYFLNFQSGHKLNLSQKVQHNFQTPSSGFFISGEVSDRFLRGEIIFKKYLDTVKKVYPFCYF